MDLLAFISSLVARVPIERVLFPPRDEVKSLEKFATTISAPESDKTETSAQKMGDTTESRPKSPPELAPLPTDPQEEIATACVPCALGHYGTCSGLLNEAMRFAKKEGIDSNEVIDRINMCMDELNALERVDLRPEVIVDLSEWEKGLANKALTGSRSLRHGLESLRNVDDLEGVAATTQTTRNEIGREWFKQRLSKMSEEEKDKVIEQAAKEGLSPEDKARVKKRAEEIVEGE